MWVPALLLSTMREFFLDRKKTKNFSGIKGWVSSMLKHKGRIYLLGSELGRADYPYVEATNWIDADTRCKRSPVPACLHLPIPNSLSTSFPESLHVWVADMLSFVDVGLVISAAVLIAQAQQYCEYPQWLCYICECHINVCAVKDFKM